MEVHRRSFLAALVGGPAAVLLQPRQRQLPSIGLQLYTVQAELESDFERTLDRVAAMGYREVEFAGYAGRSAPQVRAALQASGLSGPSSHSSWGSLGERWPGIVAIAHEIGHEHLVITAVAMALRSQPDIWRRAADQLNQAGEACKAAGIELGYHNHLFEFARIAGQSKRPYDLLMEGTDPSLVSMQMDLGWTRAASEDPVGLFKRHANRYLSVHVKDLKRLPARPADGSVPDRDSLIPDIVDVGAGVLDWVTLLTAARSAGVAHYFVEHDRPTHPLATAENSALYLSGLSLR